MIEIREKDTVTILEYLKDNPERDVEWIEMDLNIKLDRIKEIIENLEIDYLMVEFKDGGWTLTVDCLDNYNKTKKWLGWEASDGYALMADMIKKGNIKFEKPEDVK